MGARGPSSLSAGKEAGEAKPCRLLPFPKPTSLLQTLLPRTPSSTRHSPSLYSRDKEKAAFCTPKRATVQSAGGRFCELCPCICPSHVVLDQSHTLREIRQSGMSSPRCPLWQGALHICSCTGHPSLQCDQRNKQSPRATPFQAQIMREHFFKRVEY